MAFEEDIESWLPTEFLTEEEVVFMDKDSSFEKTPGLHTTELTPSPCFPTEFPYEFDSFGSGSSLSSPEESVLGSFETESSDHDEFLAGLTRRLSQQLAFKSQKKWVMAGSPESTLSGLGSWSASSNGSPNGVLSPPTTPFGTRNDTWDLIHEAAGEVARLKMNNEGSKYSNYQERGFMGPSRNQNSVGSLKNHSSGYYSTHSFGLDIPHPRQYQHQMRQEQVAKSQCSSVWGRQQLKMGLHAPAQPHHLQNQQQHVLVKGRSSGYDNGRCVRPVGLPDSAWSALQVQQSHQHHQPLQHSSSGMRAVFLGGSGVKRECAGTGVFLPRRYGNNNPSEFKKKTACSTVLLPAKVVQALNLNFDDMKMNGHGQPSCNSGFASDYEVLMARRNALLAQQRRNLRPENVLNHEIRLPQEWTY